MEMKYIRASLNRLVQVGIITTREAENVVIAVTKEYVKNKIREFRKKDL